MKCIKCGKKIPKGVSKLCEDCQKKLLLNLKEEENEIPNKNKKVKYDDGNFTLFEKIFMVLCFIVILVSLTVTIYTVEKRKKEANRNLLSTTDTNLGSVVGNTMGNIRYYGYCAMQDEWIYYYAANEDFSKNRICKIKNNGSNKSIVYEDSESSIYSINVLNGYIYFTGILDGIYSSEDNIDNKIYRMKTDGSDLEVINDNNFSNESYYFYAVKDKIYFVGTDEFLYKMNLDGSNIEQITNFEISLLGVTEKYILYNKFDTIEDSLKEVTHICDLDGNNDRAALNNERLTHVNIENEVIYYLDSEGYICKTKIDSGKTEILRNEKSYLLNVYGNYAYFFDYVNNDTTTVGIYKIDLLNKNNEPELVKTLSKLSYYIDVVRDFANYLDSTDDRVTLNLLKTDGSLRNYQLFTYEIEDVQKVYGEPEEE